MHHVDDAVVRDLPAGLKAQDAERVALFGTAMGSMKYGLWIMTCPQRERERERERK